MAYASVPAWDGLFGVMPGRAPLVAELGVGELRLDFAQGGGKGGSRSFVIDEGFAHIVANRLTILAKRAVPAESITAAEAQAELAEATARQPGGDTPSRRAAEAEAIRRERAFAQAKVRASAGGRAI